MHIIKPTYFAPRYLQPFFRTVCTSRVTDSIKIKHTCLQLVPVAYTNNGTKERARQIASPTDYTDENNDMLHLATHPC